MLALSRLSCDALRHQRMSPEVTACSCVSMLTCSSPHAQMDRIKRADRFFVWQRIDSSSPTVCRSPTKRRIFCYHDFDNFSSYHMCRKLSKKLWIRVKKCGMLVPL